MSVQNGIGSLAEAVILYCSGCVRKSFSLALAALFILLAGIGVETTAGQTAPCAAQKPGDAVMEDKSFLGERERYEVRKRTFANPEGRNLIYNSSFELGTYGWELRFYIDMWRSWVREVAGTKEKGWQIDRSTSRDGACSLMVEGRTDEQSRINLVAFRTLINSPDKVYTFSFFMKGSGLKAIVGNKTFTPTGDWQRYWAVLKGQNQYYPVIQFEGAGKVWLDAIQLEEGGEPTAFSSSSRLEFGLLTDKEDNIYYSGEKPVLRFYLHNGRDKSAQGNLLYVVQNFKHETVAQGKIPFKLGAFQGMEEARKIGLKEKGIFWVRTVLQEEGAGERDMEVNFAAISPFQGAKDPFFGICEWEATNPARQFKIAKEIGASFFTPYGPFNYSSAPKDWKEKIKNKDMVPYVLELSRKYGILLTGSIGGLPPWVSPAGWSLAPPALKKMGNITDKEFADWSDFIFTTTDRFKNEITDWEIWSEGCFCKESAPMLMRFLKPAAESVKRAGTDLRVVGNGYCNGLGSKNDTEPMFQMGALDYLDVVSIHRHQSLFNNNALERYADELERLKDMMRQYGHGREKPVWNTETGRQAINTFYENMAYGEKPSIMTIGSEEEQAERIVKINVISKAHGVERFGTFLINGINGANLPYLWGMVIGACREPKASIPAYSAMAGLLSHTLFVGEVKGIKDVRCYVFRREKLCPGVSLWEKAKSYVLNLKRGKYIAVLWDKSELQQDKWRKITLLIPDIPGTVKIIDLMGNRIAPDMREGDMMLPLTGGSPVFMVTETDPSAFLAKTEMNEGKRGITLELDLKDFSSLSNRIEARVLNSERNKAFCEVEVKKAPLGWEPINGWRQNVEIEGKNVAAVSFYLRNAKISTGEKNCEIKVEVRAGKENVSSSLAPVFCPFVQSPPNIDGDLTEWGDAVPLALGQDSAVSSLALLESDKDREKRINSAKVWLGWDKDFFYFASEVTDNIFNQPYEGEMIWAGDSIQVAFDPLRDAVSGAGYGEDDHEYGLALTKSGPCVYRFANKSGTVKDVRLAIKRNGLKTYYEAAFPWSSLAPFSPGKGNKMGFSFVIMDNDGEEKTQNWLALTPGVAGAGGKKPSLFKDLFFLLRAPVNN